MGGGGIARENKNATAIDDGALPSQLPERVVSPLAP